MIPAQNYPLNRINTGQQSSNRVKKLSLSDRRISIIAEKKDRVSSPQFSGTVDFGDRLIFRIEASTSVTDYIIRVLSNGNFNWSGAHNIDSIQYDIDNANVATLNTVGQEKIASYVGNGRCIIKATTKDGESTLLGLLFSSQVGGVSDSFVGWKSDSLAYHIQSFINNLFDNNNLTNLTNDVTVIDCGLGCSEVQVKVGSPMRYWKSWPGNRHLSSTGGVVGHQNINGPWIRDPSFYLYDLDFTGISQWTISNNNSFLVRGSLITPEHCISCAHGHEPNVGDILLFIGNNANTDDPETIYQRTVISKQKVPGCDFSISRLSEPLPSEITPFKVLPKTWYNKMLGFNGGATIPIIRWNQDHHACLNILNYPLMTYYNGFVHSEPFRLAFATPFFPVATYSDYTSKIRFLDSGNPNFLIINNEPILIGTHSTVQGGPLISAYYDDIEVVLANLGGISTSLTPADLSQYPSFSNPYIPCTESLDSASSVKMTGWISGERTLSPVGYAPYGRETYQYGDEVVRYETGVWLYTGAAGEIARVYSTAQWPWLVNWPSPYAAQKVCF